ncbi:SdiA-regulated domain-containing protein [Polaribacter vadi]|nr:SdiA-regulated domain-containing protein [Polaribacter vadi]
MIADLPKVLDEVSGTETIKGSDLIWMLNDSGNQPKLFAVSEEGKILKEIYVKTKNHDWEDLTADKKGNLYIGDFGNNNSKRKNLRILKVDKKYLNKKNAEVEKIEFEYEDQNKFPPKKKNLFFDSESFFYHNNHFYIFTKSRTKKKYGKTSLYRIPVEKGKHKAKLIGEFDNGKKTDSWITSADISDDGKKVVLLSQKNILIFTDFKGDNFLSGNVKEIELTHETQKEGICFKDNNTLLITDEKSGGEGGNLYQLKFE